MAENSFTFRHEFVDISKLCENGQDSKIRFHADLSWYVHVRSETSFRTGDVKCLGLFLNCNEEDTSNLWRCDHTSTLKLINQNDEAKSIAYEVIRSYSSTANSWGGAQIIDYERVTNSDEGFHKDDKIIVEATIRVKKVTGVRPMLKFDFNSPPSFGAENIVLNLDGQKVYVGKQYLAMHSPVFQSMFYGEFVEKGKEEIELKDVSHEEFIELLYVIYPSYKQITVDSYRFILVLADRFQMKFAVDHVESYLMSTKKLDSFEKLVVANEFRLDLLRKLHSYKSLKEVKALESRPEFDQFSDATKAAFCSRMMELIEYIIDIPPNQNLHRISVP